MSVLSVGIYSNHETGKTIDGTVPGSKRFPNHPPPTIQRVPPSLNGQPDRRPDHPLGLKNKICLDFVSITYRYQERLYLAMSNLIFVPILFSLNHLSGAPTNKLLGKVGPLCFVGRC